MNSKFLKIKCPRCSVSHVVFGKASTHVKCHGCKLPLLKTKGGKAQIRAEIREVL